MFGYKVKFPDNADVNCEIKIEIPKDLFISNCTYLLTTFDRLCIHFFVTY